MLNYEDYAYDFEQEALERNPEYKQLVKKLDHAQDHMIGLYEEISGDKEIDLRAVYWYLEEICSALDIDDTKFGTVKIKRDNNPQF